MGSVASIAARQDAMKHKGRRQITRQMRINEEHQRPIGQIKRMFHLQLEVGQAFDRGIVASFDALDEQRPQCVITAAGIAPAENEYRRAHSAEQIPF